MNRNNNKKGFTLVELIAVIAILSILLMMALPESLKLFNQGKKSAFITQVQAVYKAAEQSFISQQIPGETAQNSLQYCKSASGVNDNILDISDNDTLTYKVNFNDNGEIIYVQVTDATYAVKVDKQGAKIELTDLSSIHKQTTSDEVSCSE